MDFWALGALRLGWLLLLLGATLAVTLFDRRFDPDFPKALARWNCRKFSIPYVGGNIQESLLVARFDWLAGRIGQGRVAMVWIARFFPISPAPVNKRYDK